MNIKSQNPIRIILFLLFSICMHGQINKSNFYFGAKVGSKNGIGNTKEFIENQIKVTTNSMPTLNMGTGNEIGLFVGYQLKKNIGIEIEFDYFNNTDDYFITIYNQFFKDVNNFSSQIILFKPSIVFKTDFKRLNPYIKVGPNVGLDVKASYSQIHKENGFSYVTQFNSHPRGHDPAYGKFPVGYHANIGLEIKITKKLSVFSEISYSYLKINKILYSDKILLHEEFFNQVENTNPEFSIGSGFDSLEALANAYKVYPGYSISNTNYGFDFGIKYQL